MCERAIYWHLLTHEVQSTFFQVPALHVFMHAAVHAVFFLAVFAFEASVASVLLKSAVKELSSVKLLHLN